ncbi:sugar ABC transporter substrate-binding protein [Bifidobacterium sp. ESL0682]|uniref:ABC transporter substrate-binding protein n=1 Tax=Bifidobacterium sp. ESL0682 TaxID=2983212 RepID=UPI0023F8FB2B|nr:sugar ABC transporter substrate-binding protein [Bifidobacterium sp. ESL0682]WEV41828.1 sugar ABC transporter substrate-binding protein [Bifidobacterium sp. ESL0682]
MKRTKVVRFVAGVAAIAMAAAGLAGCGGSSNSASGSNGGKEGDLDAALQKGGTITYWTWTDSAKAQAAAFEKKYPKVHIKVVNPGTGMTVYTKLQNVLKASSGIPDISQIEYQAIPQFSVPGNLLDLSQYGFAKYKNQFVKSAWEGVTSGSSIYGLPQDTGPMVMFYNKQVFDAAGITNPPKTWDEYMQDAKILHEKDSSVYITNDSGQGNFITSMLWQAGSHAYKVNGTNVEINLNDPGAMRWAKNWDYLFKNHYISSLTNQGTEWYQAANKGKIASVVSGSWMAGAFKSSVKETTGQWRVAPMPSYDGKPASANYGGSSEVVLKKSANPALAAAFLRWLNTSQESIDLFKQSGGYVSTKKELSSEEFLNEKSDYFGGQQINKVFLESGKDVVSGWQFLPYQAYANSITMDTVGKAYQGQTTFEKALKEYQKALVTYGNQQGYKVTGK